MIFDIYASATTTGPVRSTPEYLRASMTQYRATVRSVGTDTVDVVLHVEADRLADALSDAINAFLDALRTSGDQVRAANVSGARDDDGSDEDTDAGNDDDED